MAFLCYLCRALLKWNVKTKGSSFIKSLKLGIISEKQVKIGLFCKKAVGFNLLYKPSIVGVIRVILTKRFG